MVETPAQTLSLCAKRVGIIALVLAIACWDQALLPKRRKSRSMYHLTPDFYYGGDQISGCFNCSWELKAPDSKLLNQEGSVIGQHFAGPTWELIDGSWLKGRAVTKQVAPDPTAVPWLLLESVGGTGKLGAIRFIQRTETHGGNAPSGSCTENANAQNSLRGDIFFL